MPPPRAADRHRQVCLAFAFCARQDEFEQRLRPFEESARVVVAEDELAHIGLFARRRRRRGTAPRADAPLCAAPGTPRATTTGTRPRARRRRPPPARSRRRRTTARRTGS